VFAVILKNGVAFNENHMLKYTADYVIGLVLHFNMSSGDSLLDVNRAIGLSFTMFYPN